MEFKDLKFEPHPLAIEAGRLGLSHAFDVQARHIFPNGFEVSVVRGSFSYGGNEGLYELAILRDGNICYNISIADNVIGHLTEDEVTEYLGRIEALDDPGITTETSPS